MTVTLDEIAKFKKENGFYDIEAIMVETGEVQQPGTLKATFAAFFGGTELDETGNDASELVQLARDENAKNAIETLPGSSPDAYGDYDATGWMDR